MITIADRIKEICTQKGTSMYKLEKQLNLGNGTIGKWGKNGRQPAYDKAVAVANALGVSADYLLTGEQIEKAPTGTGERMSDDEFEAYIFRLNAILAPYFVFGAVFMRPNIKKAGGFCKSPAFFDYLLHFIKVCLYIC